MKEYYEVLGLSPEATDEEVRAAYERLKAKYQGERFMEGEVGNNAAKMLTKIELAYNEIKFDRTQKSSNNGKTSYEIIEDLIRENKISDAQAKLDDVSSRDAEWHYLQSVVFYKKNWINESKKQLEIALQLDPNNLKYKTAYDKLKAKTDYNNNQANANYANQNQQANNKQMGGSDCGAMCDCCATWCCMNMLCNSCCR